MTDYGIFRVNFPHLSDHWEVIGDWKTPSPGEEREAEEKVMRARSEF